MTNDDHGDGEPRIFADYGPDFHGKVCEAKFSAKLTVRDRRSLTVELSQRLNDSRRA